MASREELTRAERDAWQRCMDVVDRVPEDRRDERTVVPGWSVKDLVWHNAYWAVTGTEELTRQAGAEFIDPYRDDAKDFADGVNAEQVETGRSLSWEEVMEQAERWRERTHALWTALGDVSDEAATFFAEETSVHYDEHTEQIRRFLAGS